MFAVRVILYSTYTKNHPYCALTFNCLAFFDCRRIDFHPTLTGDLIKAFNLYQVTVGLYESHVILTVHRVE